MNAITPDRWIFCRTEDEAARWRRAAASESLQVTVAVWEKPFKDARGYWQPPRVFWRDYRCPKCGKVFHLYWIDGFWFRNNVHIDYSEGGHHLVYPSIPDDCIYLEPSYLEHCVDEQIVGEHHESPENCDMEHIDGCVYDEAHGVVTREEREKREPYREVPLPLAEGDAKAQHGRRRMAFAAFIGLGVIR